MIFFEFNLRRKKMVMPARKPVPLPHKLYGMFPVEEDLRDAAYRGDKNRIKKLIETYPKLNLNAVNEYGETPLYIACKRNQNPIADFLLEQPGIDVNHQTILGNGAVLIAAWNDNTQLVKELIQKKADVSLRTNPDRPYHGNVSAMDIAKERGNHALVTVLAEHLGIQQQPTPTPRSS
jgi:ankyrin repeat protein